MKKAALTLLMLATFSYLSCANTKDMGKINNLTGNTYGRLTVLKFTHFNKHKQGCYECKCTCGALVNIVGSSLHSGTTTACRSCGSTKHGHSRTAVYRIWTNIKYRCYKKGSQLYPGYGGRGITVCDRWRNSFENFIADMGPRPSLRHSVERIENSGNYEPSNCKWATPKDQQNNTRMNRHIEYNGVIKTLAQWAEVYGMQAQTLGKRLDSGWSVEKSLTTPILDSKFKKIKLIFW